MSQAKRFLTEANFENEDASAEFMILDLKAFRANEVMLEDLGFKEVDDFYQTLETLFDEEWCVGRKRPDKCIYLKLVKRKANGVKGSGSAILSSSLKELEEPNSIICLYASPIHPLAKKQYNDEEHSAALLPLKNVYTRLGFKNTKNKYVMYQEIAST